MIGSSHRGGRSAACSRAPPRSGCCTARRAPVLVAPRGYAGGELRRILVGHDGGEEAQGALELALAGSAKVRLLRVIEPIATDVQASMVGAPIPPVDIETEGRQGLRGGVRPPRRRRRARVRRRRPRRRARRAQRGRRPRHRRLPRLRAAALRAAGQRLREARPPGRLPRDGRPARRGGRGRRPARRHHRDRPAGMSPPRVLVAGGGVAAGPARLHPIPPFENSGREPPLPRVC